jgi:hypothetical protein
MKLEHRIRREVDRRILESGTYITDEVIFKDMLKGMINDISMEDLKRLFLLEKTDPNSQEFTDKRNELIRAGEFEELEAMENLYGKHKYNNTICYEVVAVNDNWVDFDFMKAGQRPERYGKYFVRRKDGKVHWETWNGSGWAYNGNTITHFREVAAPKGHKILL